MKKRKQRKGRLGFVIFSVLLLLTAMTLAGCGDSSANSNSNSSSSNNNGGSSGVTSAKDLAGAYLSDWEANDGAKMDTLFAQSSVKSFGVGSTQRLLDRNNRFGNPVKGSGRILSISESGGTATADVAVVLDCQNVTGCTSDLLASQPEWAGKGRVVAADNLTMQRQTDGSTWAIIAVKSSTYLQDQAAAATETARTTMAVVRMCLGGPGACDTPTPKH